MYSFCAGICLSVDGGAAGSSGGDGDSGVAKLSGDGGSEALLRSGPLRLRVKFSLGR